MMSPLIYPLIAVSLLLALLCGWFLAARKNYQQNLARLQNAVDELKQEKLQLQAEIDRNRQIEVQLRADLREQQTLLKGREDRLAELDQQFQLQKQQLKDEFKVLSEEILNERQKALKEQNQEGLSLLLKPLQQQLDGFQRRINEVHSESLKGQTSLEAEIRKVMEVGLKMREDASNLTQALKGDAQQRGAWGEAQLERTLEMSGLVSEVHYTRQSAFRDAQGRQKQTDYLIRLPDDKQIIIDSKVSLVAYDQAISATSDEERSRALDEHARAVRKHIDDLAGKDYTNLIGMRSPSFVLMFMPIEPAYIEALKHNKDLFSYGYDKGIILVSHTTLIPILRTVANLWMLDQSNREAREISSRAGEIYNQVCLVAERLQKLGNTLNTASNHYNDTITALAGQQGLYGKVERFTQLSSKVSKTLPKLETSHMDFHSERLNLIAEALPEPEADRASDPQDKD